MLTDREVVLWAMDHGLSEQQAEQKMWWLKPFAHNVMALEREECARVCEVIEGRKWQVLSDGGTLTGIGPADCARAIRARGEQCQQ